MILAFYGISAKLDKLNPHSRTQQALVAEYPYAWLFLNNDGSSFSTINQAGSQENYPGEWLLSGNPTSYEVRATMTQLPDGIYEGQFDAWLPLSTSRVWKVFAGGEYTATSTIGFRLDIRQAGVEAILTSANYLLSATAS